MFRKKSRSWIALGNPVGPPEEAEELIWEFQERCYDADVKSVFYQAGDEYLSYYMDLGLTFFKIGEEGRVNLEQFSEANVASDLVSNSKLLKERGYQWELISPQNTGPYMSTLRKISESNLRDQNRKEPGFSLGTFNERYLHNFPIALIKRDERIVAFSNILQSGNREELSTDLLRYQSKIPHNIIDFMILETIKWGAEEGYRYFNLGMAPLSGKDEDYFSSRWRKMADFIYRYGENFYGLQSVRSYKEQYHPDWEPKYLICPAGLALPGILSNLKDIVSGGLKSLVSGKVDSQPHKKNEKQDKDI